MKKKLINKEINIKPVFSINNNEINPTKNNENIYLKRNSILKKSYIINNTETNINSKVRKEKSVSHKKRDSIMPNFNSYERFKKKLINLISTENNVNNKFKRNLRRENTTVSTLNNNLRKLLHIQTNFNSGENSYNDSSYVERNDSFNPAILRNLFMSENLKKKGYTVNKEKKKKIKDSFEKEKEKNDYDNFNVLSSSVCSSENENKNNNDSRYIYLNNKNKTFVPKRKQFSRFHSIIEKDKKLFQEATEEKPVFNFIEDNSNSNSKQMNSQNNTNKITNLKLRKKTRFNTTKDNYNNINYIQMFEYEQKTYKKELAYNKTIRTIGYNMQLIKKKIDKEHGKKILIIQNIWLKRFYLRLAKIVKIQRNFKKYFTFKKNKLQKMIIFSNHLKKYYFKLFFKNFQKKNNIIKIKINIKQLLLKIIKKFVYNKYFKYFISIINKKNKPILLDKEIQFDPIPIIKENIINIQDTEEKQLKRMFGDYAHFVGMKVFPRPSVEVSGNRYILLRKYNMSKMIEKNNLNNTIIFNDNIKYICYKIKQKEENNNNNKENKKDIINNVAINNKIDSFYSHKRNLTTNFLLKNEDYNFKKILKNKRCFFITKNLYKKYIINYKIKKIQKKIKQFIKNKRNINYNKKKQLNYFIVYFVTIFNQNVQKFFLNYFYNKYKLNTNENSSNLIINDEIFENESYSNNYSKIKKYIIESSNFSNINSK